MSKRSAREIALQVLFEVDLSGAEPGPALFRALLRNQEAEREAGLAKLGEGDTPFLRRLVDGVSAHRVALDEQIAALAHGWEVPRMPAVDRNLLRMAMFEIEHDGLSPALAINEAVELAKAYSTPDSSRFINGVLAGYLRRRGEQGGAEQAEQGAPDSV